MPEIRNPNLESQGPGGGAPGGDFRSLILFTFLALAALMAADFDAAEREFTSLRDEDPGDRAAAGVFDEGAGFCEAVRSAGAEGEVGAGLGERSSESDAQAAGCAGQDSDPAVESESVEDCPSLRLQQYDSKQFVEIMHLHKI